MPHLPSYLVLDSTRDIVIARGYDKRSMHVSRRISKMDDVAADGRMLCSDAIKASGVLRRRLRRLAYRATSCLDWHNGQMEADPEYRAAVEHLTKRLSELSGRLGGTVRGVVASHGRVVKML